MFGSSLPRLLATSLGFVVGVAGVLVLSFSLLIALASPAASAAGSPMGRAPGMSFVSSARLDPSSVDDLRATSRLQSAPAIAACRAVVRAGSASPRACA